MPNSLPAASRRAAAAVAVLTLAAACRGKDTSKPADSAAAQAAGPSLPPPLNPDPTANTYAPELGIKLTDFKKTPSGLYVRDDKVGTGATAQAGHVAHVHYTGWLANGKKFDSSRDHGTPFTFTPGTNSVIAAWDEAVPGMRVGGTRTIVVPAALGYGAAGAEPDIPGNAVLVFKMELVKVD